MPKAIFAEPKVAVSHFLVCFIFILDNFPKVRRPEVLFHGLKRLNRKKAIYVSTTFSTVVCHPLKATEFISRAGSSGKYGTQTSS